VLVTAASGGSFLPLMLPSLGVFSLAGSFRCLFLLLFLGALYVVWVLFYVGLFSVRTLFFSLLYDQCVPFAILKPKNRKTDDGT
jgi:hypothetical protein